MSGKQPSNKVRTPSQAGATTLTEAQLDEVAAGESKMKRVKNLKQLALAPN